MKINDLITAISVSITLFSVIFAIYASRKNTYINIITSARLKYIDNYRNLIADFCSLISSTNYDKLNKENLVIFFKLNSLLKLNLDNKHPIDIQIINEIDIITNMYANNQIENLEMEINKLITFSQEYILLEWSGVKEEAVSGILSKKKKAKLINNTILKTSIFFISFILFSNILYSQISITEIEKNELKIVSKPEPYDSINNFEEKEKISDYKQYIGLQLYLPPFKNPETNNYSRKISFRMYSTKPTLLNIDTTDNNLKIEKTWHQSSRYGISAVKSIYFTNIFTFLYKPYLYEGKRLSDGESENYVRVGLSNDTSQITNRYYKIVDVIYGNKLNSIISNIDSLNEIKREEIKKIIDTYKDSLFYNINSKIWDENSQKTLVYFDDNLRDNLKMFFLIKDEVTGDSIYCTDLYGFILVPYFVKQKELFQNHYLIYDDEKTSWGSYKNYTIQEYDPRFLIKYEDNEGNEKTKMKKVFIEPGSKWYCVDVSLVKPSYKITYILKNDKNEEVSLLRLNGFIEQETYLKREADKKMQNEILIAKQKQEKLQIEENQKKINEQRKKKYIDLYGQQNGELIAQGKVRINMSQEMCKSAWGTPLWTSKTITEEGSYENWFYWLGYSLHFENGILKRIEQ